MPTFEMKKVTGKRIKKWFVGTLIASPNVDVKFKFTYDWDMEAQVKVIELSSKKTEFMSLNQFHSLVNAKTINHKYVLFGKK